MKFAHTGDLHIGKKLHERSLLDDQRQVLDELLQILCSESVELLIIAGDIYDRAVPQTEAVRLFDDFVYALKEHGIRLAAISGNHDSMERISFGSRLMNEEGIYFQENFDGKAQRVELSDEFGRLNIYMVPFIKPSHMNMTSYDEAFQAVLDASCIDYDERNILVAHQFFTGCGDKDTAILSGSETINVGGIGSVGYDKLRRFDYVALGHLHRPQSIGCDYIRYSGSPLKYSFSEWKDTKSVVIGELGVKGELLFKLRPLTMPHELKVIEGTIDELTSERVWGREDIDRQHDYICAVVKMTDQTVGIADRLSGCYANILNIQYKNNTLDEDMDFIANVQGKNAMELFSDFFSVMNQSPMNEEQTQIITDILKEL